ncbi:hypothetical protein HB943_05240 [Listeria weihenstephanensis]|uniref:Uncharacterized protein n=1 Tax=Listeria weihenstephanensis TaxID=1006155 RepID=A0A841Z404_9LIST|nr:hypothetical protein [Listeria weihenstephanensis]MBC1500000.1 hypothetical protein [Listeria weihenstephanensis]
MEKIHVICVGLDNYYSDLKKMLAEPCQIDKYHNTEFMRDFLECIAVQNCYEVDHAEILTVENSKDGEQYMFTFKSCEDSLKEGICRIEYKGYY